MAKRRMTRPKAARLLGALGLALGLATGTTARPGGLQIDWWTTDTGGGASSGGSFTLSGTGGQPDAGLLQSADGALRLEGGFWAGAAPPSGRRIFVPLLRR
jgi:hypothetical protein